MPAETRQALLERTSAQRAEDGPIIIPKIDQFASQAEFRAKLREYQARSTADLKAGNISRATHDREMRAIDGALGRSGN